MSEMKLYSGAGERLYLTSQERDRFEEQSRLQPRDTMTFAMTMLYTGCRISEALNIQIKHVDLESRAIMILSLKKRGQGHVRSIPVPEKLIDSLNLVH